MRRFLVRLAMLAASLLVTLLVVELGLRFLLPQPISWLSVYTEDEALPYRLQPGATQLVNTGETTWTIFVDEAGYRARDPAAGSGAEGPYLLGLGDSFSFGHGVDYEASLFALVESELDGPMIRNAAVPGYGPEQYRQVLEKHLGDPGLQGVLIASFLGNDFFDCVWNKRRPITDGALGAAAGRRYWLKSNSHLYRFLSANAHLMGVGRDESDLALNAELLTHESWREGARLAAAEKTYREELGRMQELCREAGLPLFVVLLPARASVDDGILEATRAGFPEALGPDTWERDLPTLRAAAILEELDLARYDTSADLRALGGGIYFRFDGHFRPETAAALAREIAPRLAQAFATEQAGSGITGPEDPQDG